jgi:tRNA (guanine10-N2)-dimethyltransferase
LLLVTIQVIITLVSDFIPQSIAILGRQPDLGIAELESLYGAESIQKYGDKAAILNKKPDDLDFSRLGGSVKLCQILTTLPSDWNKIEEYLLNACLEHQKYVPDGKLTIGISVYGIKVGPQKINKTALGIKKSLKTTGRSVRIVPNKSSTLNSAQVLHNKLTAANGWELVIIGDGSKEVFLALTTNEQDIEAYTARDQVRPARDAKVGMLPPKLAQIIINLACGQKNPKILLDPFCGTGVVLQEAAIAGFSVYGTDLEPRMVRYSRENLNWLKDGWRINFDWYLEEADATTHRWRQPVDTVACETFLGQPLTKLPVGEHLSKIIYEANLVNHKFLQNISAQLKKGTRLCIAVPVWRGKHEFLHLPMLDHLTDMGYTRIRFNNAKDDDLIYHRDGQVVGRELLVLEKSK